MRHDILVGSDPELFVKRRGKYVSAHGMVKGTKEEPFIVDNGAVQVDGMALEFNTDPARDADEFVHNIGSVMKQLKRMVPGYQVVADATAEFGDAYMAKQPFEAKELGCEPDFNAWKDGAENPKPNAEVSFRTGSGHVHVGLWKPGYAPSNHLMVAIQAAKQFDFHLGLPSVVFDTDTKRRDLYGKAGCFRLKPYGLEYRVLSNKWVSSVKLQRFVHQQVLKAVADLQRGKHLYEYYDVQDCINNSDVEKAKRLIYDYGLMEGPIKIPLTRRYRDVG